MRRVITENFAGRSRILTSDDLGESVVESIWDTSLDNPLGFQPGAISDALSALSPGANSWRLIMLPPFEMMREFLKKGVSGLDENGFHRTGTIDHVVVLGGPVTLALDDGEVELQPGDVVVQRDTNHAWFNHGERPIHLLCLMTGLTK